MDEKQLIEKYELLRKEADELQARLDEIEEKIVEMERQLPDGYEYDGRS